MRCQLMDFPLNRQPWASHDCSEEVVLSLQLVFKLLGGVNDRVDEATQPLLCLLQ
jgi:hypothetical protein